ncbi:MAG: universal stress protein [Paracoccaceae bacterium]|nr:universal stress protein [Paracoccaceae bacterium]
MDLLVPGAGGQGAAQAPTLGGTARTLAETFPGSVLIVPERIAADRASACRVIVPMDGSRAAEAALRYGAEIARDRAAELVVLHAVQRIAAEADGWAEAGDGTLLSRVQPRADRAAAQRLERLHRLLPTQNRAGWIVRLGGDDPRRALLRAIAEENGELVVLSARGFGTDLTIGSTAEYLLSRVVTPTLLVRTAEAGPHPATIMVPRGPRAKAGRER